MPQRLSVMREHTRNTRCIHVKAPILLHLPAPLPSTTQGPMHVARDHSLHLLTQRAGMLDRDFKINVTLISFFTPEVTAPDVMTLRSEPRRSVVGKKDQAIGRAGLNK